MLSWVFVMAPIVADESQSLGEIAVALAYPLLDIALLGVLVRLVLQPGAQPMSLRLLIGALVAFLASDFPYAVMSLTGGYETGNIVDLGWMVGAVLWGSAALHPSMLSIGDPVERSTADQFSAFRLLLLVAASLMGPAVLVYQWVNGEPIDVPVIAAGCVTIFLLVIMRLGTVVDALRTTLDERRVLEGELERRALHDPLTGLANRTLFHDRLGHALARRSGSVAVMFLDLDDFKTVNDAYGHAAGDKVLRAVADALAWRRPRRGHRRAAGRRRVRGPAGRQPRPLRGGAGGGAPAGRGAGAGAPGGLPARDRGEHWDQPGQRGRRLGRDADARRGHRHVRGQGPGQGHVHRLRADRAPRRGPRPGAAHRPRPRDPRARVRAPLPADPVAGDRRGGRRRGPGPMAPPDPGPAGPRRVHLRWPRRPAPSSRSASGSWRRRVPRPPPGRL